MNTENEKPFIPRDKPKSYVLFLLSVLSGILIASPLLFLGAYFGLVIIKGFGTTLFIFCLLLAVFSGAIFLGGLLSGKYRNIQEQEWEKQLW